MGEIQMQNDEYTSSIMKGIRWIPIYKKAMTIHEELEKRNVNDVFYKNSLGDVLYLGLGMLQMMIDDEPSESLDKLLSKYRDEYITAQEDNLQFMRQFGHMEKEFESKLEESRMVNNRMGNWKAIPKKAPSSYKDYMMTGEMMDIYKTVENYVSQEDFITKVLEFRDKNRSPLMDIHECGEIVAKEILKERSRI